MRPLTPLMWAVAAGAWASSGLRAMMDGHHGFGALCVVVGGTLGGVAAWCQHRAMEGR